jgi:hypothetical protein
MGTGLLVAAALAAAAAVVVARFLPGREPAVADVDVSELGAHPVAGADRAA